METKKVDSQSVFGSGLGLFVVECPPVSVFRRIWNATRNPTAPQRSARNGVVRFPGEGGLKPMCPPDPDQLDHSGSASRPRWRKAVEWTIPST